MSKSYSYHSCNPSKQAIMLSHLRFNVAIENSRGAITICTATEEYWTHFVL